MSRAADPPNRWCRVLVYFGLVGEAPPRVEAAAAIPRPPSPLVPVRIEAMVRTVLLVPIAAGLLAITLAVTHEQPDALAWVIAVAIAVFFVLLTRGAIVPARHLERPADWPADAESLTERHVVLRQVVRCAVVTPLLLVVMAIGDVRNNPAGGLDLAAIVAGSAISGAISWRRSALLERRCSVRIYRRGSERRAVIFGRSTDSAAKSGDRAAAALAGRQPL